VSSDSGSRHGSDEKIFWHSSADILVRPRSPATDYAAISREILYTVLSSYGTYGKLANECVHGLELVDFIESL
jgi:hypothetical protein